MSFHQSSVYAGTIAGGTVAGFCGQYYGWRSGFYLFGILGVLLGVILIGLLKEPKRGQAEPSKPPTESEFELDAEPPLAPLQTSPWEDLRDILRSPMVPILVAVFVGANFVAMIFLTWMPTFLNDKFGMSLAMAGLNGTAWLQIASVLGVLSGGFLADRLVQRHRGGRMMTQALGLLAGVPFIFLTGWTLSVPVLVVAMVGFGFFKGIYDANIWASLYDVVEPSHRATALGFMNAIGWAGGAVAPVAIAAASGRYGMSACLSATSLIYLLFGLLLISGIWAFMRPREVVVAGSA
jgi:sugar phosphate permease